jgi:peroxiredoxin
MTWLIVAAAWAAELHGERPSAPVPAPEFQAVAHTGAARTRTDLMGHPTVLWFFPIVGTPG